MGTADYTDGLISAPEGNVPLLPTELRVRRLGLGLTQAALAHALGVAPNTVARWERGQRAVQVPHLVRLALDRLEAESPAREAAPPPTPPPVEHQPAARQAASSDVPIALTSFIGRDQDLATLERLLDASRLVTVVGPAGIGKTRLAVALATRRASQQPGSVRWVSLAPVDQLEDVARVIAGALGVLERAGRPTLETVAESIGQRPLLLVLDNCEHLVSACATATGFLLRSCPNLRVAATSREALGLGGEVAWLVPPLGVPLEPLVPPPGNTSQWSAVQLFVERAVAVSQFSMTDHAAPYVFEICRRLDGLPLAIELAAARTGTLGVEELAARLDDRFELLIGRDRTSSTRQQTLRAAVDWSYSLLSAAERCLFERLSVFVGGWSLDAAETVGADEGLGSREVLRLLAQLVDKSMVVAEPSHGGSSKRYRMLETLRQYGREQLTQHDDLQRVRRRHAEFCLDLASTAASELWGPDGQAWRARLAAELDNLRAALSWSLEFDPELGIRLTGYLWGFWLLGGFLVEGDRWLQALLPRAVGRTRARAIALLRTTALTVRLAVHARSCAWLEESHALFERLGDVAGRVEALHALSAVACLQSERERARAHIEQAIALAADGHPPTSLGVQLVQTSGVLAFQAGDLRRAQTLLEQSLAAFGALPAQTVLMPLVLNLDAFQIRTNKRGDVVLLWEDTLLLFRDVRGITGRAYALANLASLARINGAVDQAQMLLRESLACFQAARDRHGVAQVLCQMGNLAAAQGEHARSRRLLQDSLTLRRELGDRRGIGLALLGLARLALAEGGNREASAIFVEALQHFREMADLPGICETLDDLADVASTEARFDDAEAYINESLRNRLEPAEDRGLGQHGLAGTMYTHLAGRARSLLKGPADPATAFCESLELQWRAGDTQGLCALLQELAEAARKHGDLQRAARVLGAVSTLVDTPDDALAPPARPVSIAAAWREGRHMTPEQALAHALAADYARRTGPPASPVFPVGLTEREVEVLRMVVGGLTNREIAARLTLSERTIATHVDHIFTKAGVSSRAAVTAFALRAGIA